MNNSIVEIFPQESLELAIALILIPIQKQQMAIARVLANDPIAALDSKTLRKGVNLMKHLAKEKKCTIMLVTNNN